MRGCLILFLVLTVVCESWSTPKPLESIGNYNVLMIHGAYGAKKGVDENKNLKEAYSTSNFLGNATLGSYTSNDRITKWLGTNVFEEPDIGDKRNPSNAYIYNWRSFTNPANTSLNNAHEMGDRMWNAKTNGSSKFGQRRALFEEAQEVKASCCHAALVAASPFLKCSQKFIQCYLALCNTLLYNRKPPARLVVQKSLLALRPRKKEIL